MLPKQFNAKRRKNNFNKCTLYVTRHTKGQGHRDSRPCYDCFKKIQEFGIKKIVYTTKDGAEACKTSEYFGGDPTKTKIRKCL